MIRDEEEDEEDFPTGCACCLGVLVWPMMLLFVFFILLWFIPLPG